MPVYASLVLGADGSSSKSGSSRLLSSGADRTAFLERRRQVDFILIGGRTARSEPYLRTPVPVVVASHSMVNSLASNRLAHWWNTSPAIALERGIARFGENVLVEAGALFINQLINDELLDGIYLSITKVSDGEDKVNYEELIANFASVKKTTLDGDTFIEARKLK